MNDFTKEELKRLLLRSFSWVSYPENQNKDELELINKIQSLIDNYDAPCEHHPVLMRHLTTTGESVGLITCCKCMVII